MAFVPAPQPANTPFPESRTQFHRVAETEEFRLGLDCACLVHGASTHSWLASSELASRTSTRGFSLLPESGGRTQDCTRVRGIVGHHAQETHSTPEAFGLP